MTTAGDHEIRGRSMRGVTLAGKRETSKTGLCSRVEIAVESRSLDIGFTVLECGGLTPLSISMAATEPTAKRDWPHAPVHRVDSRGVYIVTASTLHKEHFFAGAVMLDLLEGELLSLAKKYEWEFHAWSVFSNHYHFVARSEREQPQLREFLSHLHSNTSRELNRLHGVAGRNIWYNFWDTKLTYERSYLARLNYVHQNPVKHGLVMTANQYRWCSAGWFERTSSPAMVKTVYRFKIDKLSIADDY